MEIGNYALTVTDASGCSATRSDILLDTPPIVISAEVDSFFCLFDPNGQISATASGGNPFPGGEYEFNDAAPSTDFVQENPMATFEFMEEDTCFTIKVEDNSGCIVEECIRIPIRNRLPLIFDTIPPDCSRPGYSASVRLDNFGIGRFGQVTLFQVGVGVVMRTSVGPDCSFAGVGTGCGNPNANTCLLYTSDAADE